MDSNAIIDLLQTHGLLLVTALSLVEGPIVTVISSYLATLGVFSFVSLIPILIVGDLLGDIAFYVLGRYGRHLIPARFGLADASVGTITRNFDERGGRLLAFGKLTHAAGAAVLISAGIARMPVLPFLFYNTLATIPKTLFFTLLGALFGQAHETIAGWIGPASLGILALFLIVGGVWWWTRR